MAQTGLNEQQQNHKIKNRLRRIRALTNNISEHLESIEQSCKNVCGWKDEYMRNRKDHKKEHTDYIDTFGSVFTSGTFQDLLGNNLGGGATAGDLVLGDLSSPEPRRSREETNKFLKAAATCLSVRAYHAAYEGETAEEGLWRTLRQLKHDLTERKGRFSNEAYEKIQQDFTAIEESLEEIRRPVADLKRLYDKYVEKSQTQSQGRG